MTVKIIVHRGTEEIGGNCVEVRTDSTRIILDVGMPLVDENGESVTGRFKTSHREAFQNQPVGVYAFVTDPL